MSVACDTHGSTSALWRERVRDFSLPFVKYKAKSRTGSSFTGLGWAGLLQCKNLPCIYIEEYISSSLLPHTQPTGLFLYPILYYSPLSLSFFIDVYFHSLAAVQKRTALLAQTATSCLCLGERQGGSEKRPQIPRDETATTTPATLVLRCCCDFFDPRVLPSFMSSVIFFPPAFLCLSSLRPNIYYFPRVFL